MRSDAPPGYVATTCSGWRLWVLPPWLPHVGELLAAGGAADGWVHRSKHARTRRVCVAGASPAYLKLYHRYRWGDAVKDMVRSSKAEHALVMSLALERAGFPTAPVLVAGVLRRWGVVRAALLVTEDVKGPDVRGAVTALARGSSPVPKWELLRRLGDHIGRLHDAGFVHGDLVPTNVRVVGAAGEARFVLLDHDRTRRRRRVGAGGAARNLVQLNRFAVAGLTAADRWRVFRAYWRSRGLDERRARRLARRVVRKTVERRRRFDGIEAAARMDFRALMRADADGR